MNDHHRPLKNAFGRFATGIGVAACPAGKDGFAVLTINSFTSVSLDPPLVLWCIERGAATFSAFMAAQSYAVSILKSDQRALSDRFAGYAPAPLSPGEIDIGPTGAPLLKGRLAGFDCRISARHEAGDHVIMVGEVAAYDSDVGEPLVYYASNYHEGFEKQ